MREMTDTANLGDLPDGPGLFKVVSVEKFYGKSEFFVWQLAYEKGQGKQVLLPNMMGPLLRILGCDEVEPNKFDWETELQANKMFKATVSHAPDKNGVMRQRMGDFEKYDEKDERPF